MNQQESQPVLGHAWHWVGYYDAEKKQMFHYEGRKMPDYNQHVNVLVMEANGPRVYAGVYSLIAKFCTPDLEEEGMINSWDCVLAWAPMPDAPGNKKLSWFKRLMMRLKF